MKNNRKIRRFIISGTNSGCGKTTVICAVMKRLISDGLKVSSFKCGPDYIDPMFHREIIGTDSYNLDSFFCDDNTLKYLFYENSKGDISVVEGVMGFYDGVNGKASSYEISQILNIPAIIVIDCKGMSTSIGAVIKGFLLYRQPNNIKGFIFNRLPEKLTDYIKTICAELNTEFLGYIPECKNISIKSRNLGLLMPDEIDKLQEKTNILSEIVKNTIDIKRILEISSNNTDFPEFLTSDIKKVCSPENGLKIGIARDKAFSFIYQDNINILKKMGCEIEFFSPLRDKKLPSGISGIILSGGYPELYIKELTENKSFIEDIRNKINNNIPIIAECGGFMYLHKMLDDFESVGVVDGKAFKTEKLQRFGYINIQAQKDNILCRKGETIPAHEFHYWDSTSCGTDFKAFKASNNKSWKCVHAGENYYMGFPHIYFYSNPETAENFLKRCIKYRREKSEKN